MDNVRPLTVTRMYPEPLRERLVNVALEWQELYGVAPSITAAISELDAAHLIGMPADDYSEYMKYRTAVSRGADFVWRDIRYQVKANRPSGKPGSPVTLVPKAGNYEWDELIWILCDTRYRVIEAWIWEREAYRLAFHELTM